MSNIKTICIDCRILTTGIGTYVTSILAYFKGNDDWLIYALVAEGQNEILPLNIKLIPFKAGVYSVREQFEFSWKIPRVDIFWSPHYNIPLLPIKAKVRIVTIHDVYHLAYRSELTLKQKIYSKIVLAAAVKLSKKVITVSEFSKSEIIKYLKFDKNKINVIENGVKQIRNLKSFDAIQKKYNLPSKYILYLGSVKPHKNLKRLLEAYEQLNSTVKEANKVVIVGKVDGFITGDPKLISYIRENPSLKENVVFTGFIEDVDMDAIYSNANIFVFPSLYEGFGLPPLEAMLNECPVTTSSIPSLKEVCGNAAMYFDPSNIEDIKQKIESFIMDEDLKQQFVERGKICVKNFTWKNSYEKHLKIFDTIN
ncbi:glycosyltransferase family 4 protein [Pedobacter rhodius]|uniref:Glycosyltransferase family 1 protein n=1 Tax=Pedobacter rhodius TaxID=3004098 RepID=A0ABT4KZL2_9SPHI|nr:glycosyltransferase family 1 protein [Pedobacter sp. SJ11]MCZ4224378.1 glycosyltransferase family 1 protein [Pedobacter sp. SJ11]